jgi:hypothetical protein
MIEVTRKSPLNGLPVSMSINTTELKIEQWDFMGRAPGTPLIQDFFGECSDEEREFILTGIRPEEWAKIFGSPEAEIR